SNSMILRSSRLLSPRDGSLRQPHALPTRRSSDLVAALADVPARDLLDVLAAREHLPHRLGQRAQTGEHLVFGAVVGAPGLARHRSEEHTSELQHVKTSYAAFCLKKKRKRVG